MGGSKIFLLSCNSKLKMEASNTASKENEMLSTSTNVVEENESKYLGWGMSFAFRLGDPLLPGEKIPEFEADGLVVDFGINETVVSSNYSPDKPLFFIFHPGIFSNGGENYLNLLLNMTLDKEAKDKLDKFEIILVSTDSLDVIAGAAYLKEVGLPKAVYISDKTGEVASAFGVLDKKSHRAFNAIFLVDENKVVQFCNICGLQNIPAYSGIFGIDEIMALMDKAVLMDEPNKNVLNE